ncbi:serine/threonine-protein kinase Chk1-like [Hypanus sabinus]|uniref:serine/threonine-protein kinase Chk1-like n=1 Tax=Hypanus sabinus TaxID=79690 RepID=UPI0028C4F527|nr:serine/threonine-protein kinase Chk1-like [Hypanus sabinus]
MTVPFVEDWDLVQTLGEGAYGQVQLAINRTKEAVAVKKVDTTHPHDCPDNIKKEICINKMLNHCPLLQASSRVSYPILVLEYYSEEQLFDRIEPDVGMPEADAHRFFQQLTAGTSEFHRFIHKMPVELSRPGL